MERWTLSDLITIAHQSGIPKERSATSARLAQEFRNLIHPASADV